MVSIAIISFAKFKTKQSRDSMSAVMNYAMNPDKTMFEKECLVSGLNCSSQTVYHEFVNTKLLHGKDSGRMYYHMTQAFPKGEAVPPKIAHEMAVKLAEHFMDFEVLICTHLDRDHIHSHLIINSVSLDTGWEAKREIFFNSELAFSEGENQTDVPMGTPDIGGIMGDVVRLGKFIGHLGDVPPVKDSTTKPVVKERKKAVGQKKDDHSGHDFEMTM